MKYIKIISAAMIAMIIIATVIILQKQEASRTLSTVITRSAPELGNGAHLLLPNLKSAIVVAPDRPHDPSELHDPVSKDKIKRLRQFQVTTTDSGHRATNPFPQNKPRILAVGDSVTFGWGVTEEESYPHRLGSLMGISIENAGVPAMKPQHIARWLRKNKSKDAEFETVLFARRIDWGQPNPWETYFKAIQDSINATAPAKFVLILPPISTFDPRGLMNQDEELKRLKNRFPQLPILELTPAFRKSAPQTGISLKVDGPNQLLIDNKTNTTILTAKSPPIQPGVPALAPEITGYFEANPEASEPLFFDGGHPTAEGFEVFATEVHNFLTSQELFKP
ncbi:MAG: hypothetical protein VXZ96_11225 [Myxococcota bacterium]|nr:hypothetical protein [Myxococcota bacterium]